MRNFSYVVGLVFAAVGAFGCEAPDGPAAGRETPSTVGGDGNSDELLLRLDPNASRNTEKAGSVRPKDLGSYYYGQLFCKSAEECIEEGGAHFIVDPNDCSKCISDDDSCTVQLEGSLGGGGKASPAYGSLYDRSTGTTTGSLTWGSYRLSQSGTRYLVSSQYYWGQYDIATAVKPASNGGLGCRMVVRSTREVQWHLQAGGTVRHSSKPSNVSSPSMITSTVYD